MAFRLETEIKLTGCLLFNGIIYCSSYYWEIGKLTLMMKNYCKVIRTTSRTLAYYVDVDMLYISVKTHKLFPIDQLALGNFSVYLMLKNIEMSEKC